MRAVADDNTVYRAIKYRVYPTDAQSEKLSQTFGCARKVYNDALSMQRGLYEAGMPTFGQTALNAYCNRVWKDEFPFLTEVDKFALTNSLYALCAAYKNFFEGRTGYPRYKSRRGEEQSYTTNYTNGNIEVITRKGNRGFVKIPKVGKVPASIHRVPKKDWVLKSATVSRQVNGKYYISVLYQLPDTLIKQAPLPTEETTLGLDYSSPKFYVIRMATMPVSCTGIESRKNGSLRSSGSYLIARKGPTGTSSKKHESASFPELSPIKDLTFAISSAGR